MSIASELQDKINSKTAIKAAIEAKGVTVGDVKLNQYASKIDEIEQGSGDPSIPVGTGQHLVTFYDFDGKVLKRQRVNTGEDATAPEVPTHEFLTFAEWNNPFTNVQSDIDTGAIYNTTDGKTYLFITLTAVTGLAPTLYFYKNTTSLMTINWGDGTTSTSTTSGNQSIRHTYATAGDYIITVDNSAGGTFLFQQYFLGNSTTYQQTATKIYLGNNYSDDFGNVFRNCYSIEAFSLGSSPIQGSSLIGLISLKGLILNSVSKSYMFNGHFNNAAPIKKNTSTFVSDSEYFATYAKKKYILSPNVTLIYQNAFGLSSTTSMPKIYIFLCDSVPTLVNINAFAGINPLSRIYFKDALVDSVKIATNWVTYANYIYPLSQKPQSDE